MKKTLMFAAVLLLAGCSKLSMENYNQLKVGMSYQEVTAIIGDAKSCEEVIGTRSCVWGDDNKGIKAGFVADKAIAFSHKGLN
jgi:hypothetical protein